MAADDEDKLEGAPEGDYVIEGDEPSSGDDAGFEYGADEGSGDETEEAFVGEIQKSGGMKKIVAPALVLVCAAGIGAYILMKPSAPPPPVAPGMQAQPADNSGSQMPDFAAMNMDSELPQPAAIVSEEPAPSPMPEMPADTSLMATPDIPDFGAPPAEGAQTDSPPALADIQESAPPDVAAEDPAPDMPPAAEDTVSAPAEVAPVAEVSDAAPPAAMEEEPPAVAADLPLPEFPQVQEVTADPPVEDLPDVLGAGGQAASQIQGGVAESGVVGRGIPSSSATAQQVAPPAVAAPPGVDTYYDSARNVPSGPMASVGPRKADPVMEPASKFVVAKRTGSEKSEDAMVIAANRALKLGRYEAATEMFDQLYEKNRRDPRILMGRAVAYQNSGRPETALRTYEELLEVDKDNADALVNMLGLLRQQYPEVALRRLLNLFDKHPGNPGVAAQVGLTQADLGHYDDALRYLGIAASIEPQNAQHQFNMGVIADRMGRSADAVRFYEQALELDSVYGGGRTVARDQIYDRLSVLRRR